SSWASSASLGSVEYTGSWLASASMNRSVRLISLSDGSPPLEVQRPKSGTAVLRRDHLGLQPRQCPVLRDPDRTRRRADGLGGLFGAHADDNAQDQDFALFFGQHGQEPVHSGGRFGVQSHLLGTGLQRIALWHDIRRVGAIPGGGAVS